MKRITYIKGIFLLIAISITPSVFGQESENVVSTTSTNEAVQIQNDPTLTRGNNQSEHRVALLKNFQDRIINLTQNVTNRLIAGTDRMNSISTRIASRIEKLSSQGIDTAPAVAKLSEAQIAISKTQELIKNTQTTESLMRGENAKTGFAEYRSRFTEARASLQDAHTLLRETVRLIKESAKQKDLELETINQPPVLD